MMLSSIAVMCGFGDDWVGQRCVYHVLLLCFCTGSFVASELLNGACNRQVKTDLIDFSCAELL